MVASWKITYITSILMCKMLTKRRREIKEKLLSINDQINTVYHCYTDHS